LENIMLKLLLPFLRARATESREDKEFRRISQTLRPDSTFESAYSGLSDEELILEFIAQGESLSTLLRTPGVETHNRSTRERWNSLQSLRSEARKRSMGRGGDVQVSLSPSTSINIRLHDAQERLRRGKHSMYTGTVPGLNEEELGAFTRDVTDFSREVGFLIP
jgi:hypothetical protein